MEGGRSRWWLAGGDRTGEEYSTKRRLGFVRAFLWGIGNVAAGPWAWSVGLGVFWAFCHEPTRQSFRRFPSSPIEKFEPGTQVQNGTSSCHEDIVFDVLTRLPAKVLCRFRCVCKRWRALVSDESFIAAQRSRADPLIAGVFYTWPRCNDHSKFELRVMDMDGSVLRVFKDVARFLLPTRLDLICGYAMQGGAMVIDPAAGRTSAFDGPTPSLFRHYSFGRAAPSGAYKILCISETFNSDGYHRLSEIATINDCGSEPTWRQRPTPPAIADCYHDHKANVNGVLYFMSHTTGGTPRGQNLIATFDLESEEWTETIDGPAMGVDERAWPATLAELKATLNVLQTVCCPLAYHTNIWLLVDSKKSIWVKQYTIQIPKSLLPVKALDVLGDGTILLLNKKRKENGFSYQYIIQFYNPSTRAFTDVMAMADEFDGAMVVYTGSLLSSQITADGLG